MFKIKAIRPELLTLLVSLFFLLAFNLALWQHLLQITNSDWQGLLLRGSFALLLLAAFNLLLTLMAFRGVFKPLLSVLLLGGAGAAYFMNQYGVMIDKGMLRNIAETNPAEAFDLLSVKLGLYLLLLGVLPTWLLWQTPVNYRVWHFELLRKLVVITGCAAILGGVALANYQGLASLFRNHKELRLLVTPSNLVNAGSGYLREQFASAKQPFQRIGEDALRAVKVNNHGRKSLTVLVVGESARAENFSLLGYGRQTNPELQKQDDLISFPNAYSCGTETAVSVPCMFSNLGRENYQASIAENQEGLLDVLQRSGLQVIWRDNQSGCKGTCDRVTQDDVSNDNDPLLCANGECHDEILLKNLQSFIDNLQQDTVLVLHAMGSHGPAYFKRYPKKFEQFTPVCTSNALNECAREEIVNGYDNTILYTDHVLATLIDLLRQNQEKIDSGMLYISDHGESLGEYNLFLHGTPYVMAPEQQKHVGMLAWFSKGYQQNFGFDSQCLRDNREQALSHDNLFHSMLGLLQVQTSVYNAQLDMFAACRQTAVVAKQ
ncbi:MAG: phosphoethanolamine--lipid A transferase [Pseudomonadaceae bacterium]|nr:phosphoethanolamine--lipid A transferase [Pseudomonadaceae bacterium]